MGMTRPQSQRDSNQSRGTDARAKRGARAQNKDRLKSNRQKNMAGKPGAQRDQYGSRHNQDEITTQQKAFGQPGGKSDLSFREGPQDTRGERGARNRQPGRRRPKSGDQKHRRD